MADGLWRIAALRRYRLAVSRFTWFARRLIAATEAQDKAS
jgi:hypothetical protein